MTAFGPLPTRAKNVPITDATAERPPSVPRSITATAVTAYVSNRSAAMPAQSPTLSPTLSAITAGLRGSSSGMPASILPTMSAPTAGPLVEGGVRAHELLNADEPDRRRQRAADGEADRHADDLQRDEKDEED